MINDKNNNLQKVITAIQKRWGDKAIGRSSSTSHQPFPHIPTGFKELDNALAIGGIPRGRISELIGRPTSGMSTLALKILAKAQAESGSMAVYIDGDYSFDPDYARRCGVQLSHLALVHAPDVFQALNMLSDFVLNGGLDFFIFDLPGREQNNPRTMQHITSNLGRLLAPLSKSGNTLLFLSSLPAHSSPREAYPQGAALPHFATVRLELQKARWLYQKRDVHGYEAQVRVIKNKLAPPGQKVRITITFDSAIDGGRS